MILPLPYRDLDCDRTAVEPHARGLPRPLRFPTGNRRCRPYRSSTPAQRREVGENRVQIPVGKWGSNHFPVACLTCGGPCGPHAARGRLGCSELALSGSSVVRFESAPGHRGGGCYPSPYGRILARDIADGVATSGEHSCEPRAAPASTALPLETGRWECAPWGRVLRLASQRSRRMGVAGTHYAYRAGSTTCERPTARLSSGFISCSSSPGT